MNKLVDKLMNKQESEIKRKNKEGKKCSKE